MTYDVLLELPRLSLAYTHNLCGIRVAFCDIGCLLTHANDLGQNQIKKTYSFVHSSCIAIIIVYFVIMAVNISNSVKC